MSATPKYVEIHVDLFDLPDQRAQILPDLQPDDLIGAILDEFHDDFEYLGVDAGAYMLTRGDDDVPLGAQTSVGDQLGAAGRLVLHERELPLPDGTRRPTRRIYLREISSGRAVRVAWLPAIVGRVDLEGSDADLVAFDLSDHPEASRVSRRHFRFWQTNAGDYYIQATSTNAVSVLRESGEIGVPGPPGEERLLPGDVIRLERSGIHLKFIERQEGKGS